MLPILFSHYRYQNSNITGTGMLFILGEESHLDRLSLAQLTQLLLTSILECPFYKVKAKTVSLFFPVGGVFICPHHPQHLFSSFSFALSQ